MELIIGSVFLLYVFFNQDQIKLELHFTTAVYCIDLGQLETQKTVRAGTDTIFFCAPKNTVIADEGKTVAQRRVLEWRVGVSLHCIRK